MVFFILLTFIIFLLIFLWFSYKFPFYFFYYLNFFFLLVSILIAFYFVFESKMFFIILLTLLIYLLIYLLLYYEFSSDFFYYIIFFLLLVFILIYFYYVFDIDLLKHFKSFICLIRRNEKLINFFFRFFSKTKIYKSRPELQFLWGIISWFFSLFGINLETEDTPNPSSSSSPNSSSNSKNKTNSSSDKKIYPDFIKNGTDLKKLIDSPYYWYNYFDITFKEEKDLDMDGKVYALNEFIKYKAYILQADSDVVWKELSKNKSSKINGDGIPDLNKDSIFKKKIDWDNLPDIFVDYNVLRQKDEKSISSFTSSFPASFPSSTFSPRSSELADDANNFPAGWDAFEFYKYSKQRLKTGFY